MAPDGKSVQMTVARDAVSVSLTLEDTQSFVVRSEGHKRASIDKEKTPLVVVLAAGCHRGQRHRHRHGKRGGDADTRIEGG